MNLKSFYCCFIFFDASVYSSHLSMCFYLLCPCLLCCLLSAEVHAEVVPISKAKETDTPHSPEFRQKNQ